MSCHLVNHGESKSESTVKVEKEEGYAMLNLMHS